MPGKELIVAFTVDGDLIEDPNAEIDGGLIISRKYGWAFPQEHPTPLYRILGSGRQPIKVRDVLAQTRTPPDPDHSYSLQRRNGTFDMIRERAETGRDVLSRARNRNNFVIQVAALAGGFAFMLVMGLAVISFTPGQGAPEQAGYSQSPPGRSQP